MDISNIKNQPTALIVFGATGDLTQNKLYPSLYELAKRKILPKNFTLYGVAREKMTAKQFVNDIKQDLTRHIGESIDLKVLDTLLKKVQYIPADLNRPDGYHELERLIQKDEQKLKKAILRIFYLALPPSLFAEVVNHVNTCKAGASLCVMQNVHSRVILEKPFGYDYKTALKLNNSVKEAFEEKHTFRIDHYLGKDSFQTMFAFRFANSLFESNWNSKSIESIQINALEKIGAEGRFSYYDGAGAIRDMIQSHLMQFLAYLTMEKPTTLSSAALRKSKAILLSSIKPSTKGVNLVKGQYKGYKKEKGVKRGSKTETFAAVKLDIDNKRWKGVPIYIRTGKNLKYKETSAVITFKKNSIYGAQALPNRLMIQIAPVPSITLEMNVNKFGETNNLDLAIMHYCRGGRQGESPIGDYEKLLMDVIVGDQLLFTGAEEVLESWKIVDPLIRKSLKMSPTIYKKGSEGPIESNLLFSKNNDSWEKMKTTCDMD